MKKLEISSDMLAYLESARMPFALFQLVDNHICTLAVSKGFCELFGYMDIRQAYKDMNEAIFKYVHPDDMARLNESVRCFAEGDGRFDMVYRTHLRNEPDYRIIHVAGEHFTAPNEVPLSIVWYMDEGPYTAESDSQNSYLNQSLNRALHEESILVASRYDYLTGLPSMTCFFDMAENKRIDCHKSGMVPVILYTDFSGMREFNRKYGFEEGNALLHAFSGVLVRYFGKENCSRFGDDHFAVWSTGEGLEEKLQKVFAECRQINDGKTLPLRVGIYADTMGHVDASTACDRAKAACDSYKNGYTSVFRYFDRQMLETAERRQYIIDNLDRALREKWIQVYYQPIVRTANGRVSDEEALARWVDPVRGILAPAEFIPILEEARLIYKLDLYMTDQILEKMKIQSEMGLYIVPESVNLSRSDFECCDIVSEICKRMDASGIGRDKLTIEVTESMVGSDFEFMTSQIERFQRLGFSVWMDDFGSGYSSLDVLQQIHFDVIKFDMRFMQQFSQNDKCRIILTELIRMAMGLGIDTVCEGVETEEQKAFLNEVGCTKQQGYYYCRPVSFDEILHRYETGKQIGFENPEESEYYASVGRINLYDFMTVAGAEHEAIRQYFNTVPMTVIELNNGKVRYVRSNSAYRSLFMKLYERPLPSGFVESGMNGACIEDEFMLAIEQSAADGSRMLIDEKIKDGSTVHAFIKRIAVNPATGTKALAVALLSVIDEKEQKSAVTYAHIAKALSSDYVYLYYVDLGTEHFIEYRSVSSGKLDIVRYGEHFFEASRRDARRLIYSEDQTEFIKAFTKENVLKALDSHGTFSINYRLMVDDTPTYVSLKAVRMSADDHHIVIGVSNIDAQMRQQEAFERIREEQVTYARIAALSGDFICIYTINPVTDEYTEYVVKNAYNSLKLPVRGKHFFEEAVEEGKRTIYPDDYPVFVKSFTKANVLKEIETNGSFVLQYRLMLDNIPTYVNIKAAIIQEKDGLQMILGVVNVDAEVRRDHEYAHNLLEARSKANIDSLTGVKNLAAYQEMEAHFNHQIRNGQMLRFAIATVIVKGCIAMTNQKEKEFDEILNSACSIICTVFKRSPVYRVSDDTFVVIARGEDYEKLDLRSSMLRTELNEYGITAVCGTAVYMNDDTVEMVYKRALVYLKSEND